jgi:putative tryptophan/tyrosine transport system substrate-binding protein
MNRLTRSTRLPNDSGNPHATTPKQARSSIGSAILTLFVTLVACDVRAAQPAKAERIGVIHLGGVLATIVDGLRAGLKEYGLQEGKNFVLDIQDLKGDTKDVENLAKKFEQDKVKLIFSNTQVVTSAAMKATKNTPIVFAVGTDPVAQGYVQSFARPGSRLTGIHYLARDLTAKRLEILKEFLPKLRTIVTFYDPTNDVSVQAAKLGRDEAHRKNVKLTERKIKSIDELKGELDGVKAGEFDAYLYVADARVASQAQLVIDTASAKKLPTMFHDQALVASGALASYGQSYFEIGRRSAKYVQKILAGTPPADLRVETIEDVELAFNLKTAKEIGVTIPPNVLTRAAKVVR